MTRRKPNFSLVGCLALVGLVLALPALEAQTAEEIQAALDAALAKYKNIEEGANADYIPALAAVDPEHLRHRPGDGQRRGSTPPATSSSRGLDPVDLQGLHGMAKVIQERGH